MTAGPMPGNAAATQTKYCKHCGTQIAYDAVICVACGRQVETISAREPQIVINNTNTNSNVNHNANGAYAAGNAKNKWIALLLCVFTVFGHKFYEGKIGMGILYLLTGGIFGIGWIIDTLVLLFKPNPYYV